MTWLFGDACQGNTTIWMWLKSIISVWCFGRLGLQRRYRAFGPPSPKWYLRCNYCNYSVAWSFLSAIHGSSWREFEGIIFRMLRLKFISLWDRCLQSNALCVHSMRLDISGIFLRFCWTLTYIIQQWYDHYHITEDRNSLTCQVWRHMWHRRLCRHTWHRRLSLWQHPDHQWRQNWHHDDKM